MGCKVLFPDGSAEGKQRCLLCVELPEAVSSTSGNGERNLFFMYSCLRHSHRCIFKSYKFRGQDRMKKDFMSHRKPEANINESTARETPGAT